MVWPPWCWWVDGLIVGSFGSRLPSPFGGRKRESRGASRQSPIPSFSNLPSVHPPDSGTARDREGRGDVIHRQRFEMRVILIGDDHGQHVISKTAMNRAFSTISYHRNSHNIIIRNYCTTTSTTMMFSRNTLFAAAAALVCGASSSSAFAPNNCESKDIGDRRCRGAYDMNKILSIVV